MQELSHSNLNTQLSMHLKAGYVAEIEIGSIIQELKSTHLLNSSDSARTRPKLQEAISQIELKLSPLMSAAARISFQSFVAQVGGILNGELGIPSQQTSFWHEHDSSLKNYLSHPSIPKEVDVLVVGAGLTGASAAYHLIDYAKKGHRVAVVEASDVGSGASGRNGGNFELVPESFFGTYENMVREREKFIANQEPNLRIDEVKIKAVTQARILLRFGDENAKIFKSLARAENLNADISDAGWLRIADSAQEAEGLVKDVALAKSMGLNMEIWSPERIFAETGIRCQFAGRVAPGYGNYHPYKFVNSLFEKTVSSGVELYTKTRVLSIDNSLPANESLIVETCRGLIRARNVILATDAYSSKLIPDLKVIEPMQSQILTLEHLPNTMAGMTITEKNGDLYYNAPKSTHYVDEFGQHRSMIIVGGGEDRPIGDPDKLEISQEVYELVKAQTDERFPSTKGQPASRIWSGAFGFTRDRFPVLDTVTLNGKKDSRIIAFAGSQGYGGSMCMLAGKIIAKMATSPEEAKFLRAKFAPAEHYSLDRFANKS